MSSIIMPATYDMLERRKFDPWGETGKAVPAFPFGSQSRYCAKVSPVPIDKTALSIQDLQRVRFPNVDEGKVVTLDMEMGVKSPIPLQVADEYPYDGLGNVAVKVINSDILSYQYDAVLIPPKEPWRKSSDTGQPWSQVTKSMSIARGLDNPLGLGDDDYLTHLIISVFMESPNTGMWMVFATNAPNKTYNYKVIANVSNLQNVNTATRTKPVAKHMEGQTFVMPVQRQRDLTWPDSLAITHLNMGKYVVQIRGIVYRKGI
jgi:hypothetical protein